ncbi:MAG: twin-arginine translocase subunit TatB [Gammaproteobacteria bacterium]|nr:MAG: twin-arginine translocase subunit TatB [Gammaproteobacteria bacterium]
MFDIGFTEMMLIGVVSLIVIGPERLPAVARTVGTWVGRVRRFVTGVRADFTRELESGDLRKLIGDQREQINELKKMVNEAKSDFRRDADEIVSGTRRQVESMEQSVSGETVKSAGAGTAVDGTDADATGSSDNRATGTDGTPS